MIQTDPSVQGNRAILRRQLLAVTCSTKCPAELVLPAYDLAGALRDAGVATVGGFHTPIERDCLHYLLKGKQPVVICPARTVQGMRPKPEWKTPLAEGRLLVISPFAAPARRVTRALSEERNAFVGHLCRAALVIHATPGGRTEAWASALLSAGKPVWTIDGPENQALLAMGAFPVRLNEIPDWFAAPPPR